MSDLKISKYKIIIDGDWDLEDLYVLPRAYEQVYYLMYSLYPDENEGIQERIKNTYSAYPWQGGYSAVSFYNNLKYTMPKRRRPQVESIKYASLGWIELTAIQEIALNISAIVTSVCASAAAISKTYTYIHKGLAQRKLLRINTESAELDLVEKHIKFIKKSNKEMASILQIDDLNQINRKTGSELKTLKILLSFYRRLRTLSEYQISGKAKI